MGSWVLKARTAREAGLLLLHVVPARRPRSTVVAAERMMEALGAGRTPMQRSGLRQGLARAGLARQAVW